MEFNQYDKWRNPFIFLSVFDLKIEIYYFGENRHLKKIFSLKYTKEGGKKMKKLSNGSFILFMMASLISLLLQFVKIIKSYTFYTNIGFDCNKARNFSVFTTENLVWFIITILLFIAGFVIMILSEELEKVPHKR